MPDTLDGPAVAMHATAAAHHRLVVACQAEIDGFAAERASLAAQIDDIRRRRVEVPDMPAS
ncbi:MAG: hypothetical protein JO290_12835, partial [Sphingomonadaceae bacterium]|nr:hypothetical protein [Sphingomonadaceae bacterium]